MLSSELQPLTVYRVTQNSSDETFLIDDIIWMSVDKTMNLVDRKYPGWLDYDEWSSTKTNDFEVEIAYDYKVISIAGQEICWKRGVTK